jgi:hypothetical protein
LYEAVHERGTDDGLLSCRIGDVLPSWYMVSIVSRDAVPKVYGYNKISRELNATYEQDDDHDKASMSPASVTLSS